MARPLSPDHALRRSAHGRMFGPPIGRFKSGAIGPINMM
jgi:hypothetical protein